MSRFVSAARLGAASRITSRAVPRASSRVVPRILAFVLPALAACGPPAFAPAARADLVLNEVLYDPEGADTGAEFVELWNPDAEPRSLAGVTIEAGDGAHPDAWTTIFHGADGDTVRPRSAWLVAGAALTGALQNGPDAVRLLRDGAVLDLLGYGDLDAATLYEGAPAPDVGSGHALARAEDGRDTERNADDWRDEPAPTPGRANHPDARLSLVAGSTSIEPVVPWPGETVNVRARVASRGRLPIAAGRWRAVVESADDLAPGGAEALGGQAWGLVEGVALAAGESTAVLASFAAPPPGPFRLRLRLEAAAPGDTAAPDLADTASVSGRTVAAPAVVSEIAFQDRGAGEWIELWLRDAVPAPGAIAIADAASPRRPLAAMPGAPPLAAGARIVVAQDRARLLARFPLDSALVFPVDGAWPALNDTDGPDGTADRVRVFVDGIPSDDVAYDARAALRGRSLERLSPDLPGHDRGSWGESVDPLGGTPGRENSLRAPDGGEGRHGALLRASARVVRRDGGAPPLLLRLTPEARGRMLDVVVRDLLGREVRTLVRGQRFASEGAFAWDGRGDDGAPVPPGLYVVSAEARAETSLPPKRTALAVAVAPPGGAR
ncbi:MAG: lamin tail domain-containing protein [Hyphomicrobiales bacterium]